MDPMQTAIEAREQARAAHQRLDRMNGSIDKLGHEGEKTNAKIDVLDSKVDSILITLAKTDGELRARQAERAGVLDSKWRLVGVISILVASPLFYAITTLAIRGH